MTPADIAKICHDANKSYCETIGDFSQPAWEDAPLWQKESAINGVMFHLTTPQTTPEQSHINWYEEKKNAGWTYGEVKNPETKTHPCMVEYNKLPMEQRIKDYIFKNIIDGLKGFVVLDT